MTDLITGNLVEAPATEGLQPKQKEYIEGRAVIGYHSILDDYDVTISASSEAAGFAAVNVKSRLTHSGWKPAASGAQYLNVTASAGKAVDYIGLAAHTLASKAAVIDLEYSDDGASWTSILGGYAPISDAPFLLLFAAQERLRYRLAVTPGGAELPTVGVVMLGARLALQRGIYVGHRPAPFNRKNRFNIDLSEGGQILGRAVVRQANETEVDLRRITPAWERAYLAPFLRAAEEQPFFFLWNTDDRYKGEVMFAELTNEPEPVNDHKSFMACSLSLRGLA